MPIPENPQSRSEQYLNAIATGDNSGLPEFPQSRMEQYLDYIAQNGGGGGASALFITVTQTKEGTSTTETWDKTAGEIMDAMPFAYLRAEGNGVVTYDTVKIGNVTGYAWSDEGGFEAQYSEGAGKNVTAATRNDYPSVTWSTK